MNEIYFTPSCLNSSFFVDKTESELIAHVKASELISDVNVKFDPKIHCSQCKSHTTKWYQPFRLLCNYCAILIKRGVEYYSCGTDWYCSLNCLNNMKLDVKCFKKVLHDKSNEEELIPCSFCSRLFHTSCGMINKYMRNEKKMDDFICPFCMLDLMKDYNASRLIIPTPHPKTAFYLPRTFLSDRMEKYINDSSLIVRNVSSTLDPNGERRDDVVFVFQKLQNGFEVLIFIMYVEFWLSTTVTIPGNKNTMYISYLDSVGFYSPKENRTALYQNCLLCVMEYAANVLGIEKCFLWACPPPKGVEFIFNVRPIHVLVQGVKKRNKKTLLISWYHSMFKLAQERGIVSNYMTLSEYYKRNELSKVEQCSFFYGDFVSMAKEAFEKQPKVKMTGKGVDRRPITLFDEICSEINSAGNVDGLLMSYLNKTETITTPLPNEQLVVDNPLVRNRLTFHRMLVENLLQFNDLQHATHSTSMVLFFIYNPDKLFSVQRCNSCFKIIHNEYDVEYSCNECVNPSFDICEHCYLSKSHGHEHLITNMDQSNLKKMEALKHSVSCVTSCEMGASCVELKRSLLHVCDSFGICKVCKRLGLVDHAIICTTFSGCVFPNCAKIKNLLKTQETLYNNNRLNNYKKQREEEE